MPPSGFSPKAVNGLLQFVQTCFEGLLQEVRNGGHESFEAAIQHEIGQIDKALSKLHIDSEGNLTDRPPQF